MCKISTHTPAWGVTAERKRKEQQENISTHTPAWGVTKLEIADRVDRINFNSHARVGRDSFHLHLAHTPTISTHTPAWGVTSSGNSQTVTVIFQLTRPRGA